MKAPPLALSLAAASMLAVSVAQAQQTTGSPAATTTIDGRYLPNPPQPFRGDIQTNAAQSKPSWPARIVPPQGAPNILLIMTDDVGFSAPSTFGGVIPTPALDGVAAQGLRYTRFHTTALCSPTRAALLTGRNHHSVATGVVVDQATGYPGYNSVIPRDAVAIGETLRQNGYDTSWYGKDHNVPQWEASQAGPFHNWPTGPVKGFDYYYGFIGDDTSQWQPNNLFRNTTPIEPYLGNPGWNLITAQADEAIARINMLNDVQPDRPFMIYYAPGGTHSPHHPTKEWVDKISAMHLFDEGWNKLRDKIFDNQKKLGVIPADAELTAWPDNIPAWDSLSADAKKLFIRQADIYAAYLAYTDHEIGRVIQAIGDAGKQDNTLVIYISGDNGASPEGTLNGLFNEFAVANAVNPTVDQNMRFYDAWGTDQTYPHFAVGWAWAWATPYQWTKEVASHFGGTRNGMAMSWPARIKDAGGIRHQFHHVIDIVPTILEAAGLPEPVSINGIAQRPIEGVSMAYTWGDAKAPDRRTTQYFEMFGSRAIYNDGWVAAAPPVQAPWILTLAQPPADVMNGFKWELYDTNKDWTQAHDLAASMPDKLRDMQQLFTLEATKYRVFPLDDSRLARFISEKPSFTPGRREFTYSGRVMNVPFPDTGSAPSLLNRSYTITAEIDVPAGGADGMLMTDGGRFAGYGFYLLKGVPVFTWNLIDLERVKWQGKMALAPGKHTLEFDWKYDGGGLGKGGTGTLKVDGVAVDSHPMPKSLPITLAWDETFNVGIDTGTPVDDKDYSVPFPFTGKIDKLTVKLEPPRL
ncbi:arylsulfatase [Chelatococcus asaccharovorans]|uniref:Arylsulfatase n=1 Tax=Chelatococcus asaccharovorans TaxID=28210 RepID=A0A2V3UDC4_9HYPH|nr:arylsulfatase [Chelatococcus asaccharovorans]MBS7703637.1 arylsulfatase [Chelatococcus asaccharovorans]PXW61982.1 arylsulfatase [Chelatococcus asaccharovorans]CAH1669480.1 Arylsulfatase [Chelatococcus asaccharovorans]CAH1679093.1 Arylsulfatase [Chelatococcus asaccharovorans]